VVTEIDHEEELAVFGYFLLVVCGDGLFDGELEDVGGGVDAFADFLELVDF
jgi:hypothetical protein